MGSKESKNAQPLPETSTCKKSTDQEKKKKSLKRESASSSENSSQAHSPVRPLSSDNGGSSRDRTVQENRLNPEDRIRKTLPGTKNNPHDNENTFRRRSVERLTGSSEEGRRTESVVPGTGSPQRQHSSSSTAVSPVLTIISQSQGIPSQNAPQNNTNVSHLSLPAATVKPFQSVDSSKDCQFAKKQEHNTPYAEVSSQLEHIKETYDVSSVDEFLSTLKNQTIANSVPDEQSRPPLPFLDNRAQTSRITARESSMSLRDPTLNLTQREQPMQMPTAMVRQEHSAQVNLQRPPLLLAPVSSPPVYGRPYPNHLRNNVFAQRFPTPQLTTTRNYILPLPSANPVRFRQTSVPVVSYTESRRSVITLPPEALVSHLAKNYVKPSHLGSFGVGRRGPNNAIPEPLMGSKITESGRGRGRGRGRGQSQGTSNRATRKQSANAKKESTDSSKSLVLVKPNGETGARPRHTTPRMALSGSSRPALSHKNDGRLKRPQKRSPAVLPVAYYFSCTLLVLLSYMVYDIRFSFMAAIFFYLVVYYCVR